MTQLEKGIRTRLGFAATIMLLSIEPLSFAAAASCSLNSNLDYRNLAEPVSVGGSILTVNQGRVGVGTFNASSRLTIQGNSTSTLFQADDTNGSLFQVTDAGQITFGRPSPAPTPSIQVNSNQVMITGAANFNAGASLNGQLSLDPNLTSVMIGGPLGINQLPSNGLTIQGANSSAGSAAFQILDTGGNNIMTVTNDGRVGIGSPTESRRLSDGNWPGSGPGDLEVNGPVQVSSSFIILTPQPSGANPTCNSDLDGMIYLTANNGICACNGPGGVWKSVKDGSTNCNWS